jgi:hypothetical protein
MNTKQSEMKFSPRRWRIWWLEFVIWMACILGIIYFWGVPKIWPADFGSRTAFPGQAQISHQLNSSFGQLRMEFEPNQGQAPADIKYLSHLHSSTFFIRSQGFASSWKNRTETSTRHPHAIESPSAKPPVDTAQLSLQVEYIGGSNDSRFAAEDLLVGQSHYLNGSDSEQWHLNIPHFARVRHKSVYPGIDLAFYGNPSQLEFDFILSPGAKPSQIILRLTAQSGSNRSQSFRLNSRGDLISSTWGDTIQLRKPNLYQMVKGMRIAVAGSYQVLENDLIGFQVADYDLSLPLIIDPILLYTATGVGGYAVAADSNGNAFLAGIADPTFPVSSNAFQTTPGGGTCIIGPNSVPCTDIMVAKLNRDGTQLLYATFLGGSGADYAYSLAVDSLGNTYLTGTTNSANFPTTAGAFQTSPSGKRCGSGSATYPCNEAFVSKLNAEGTGLVYSTYLHGAAGGQGAYGIALNSTAEAFVTGNQENGDGFITKLNASGSTALYSQSGIGGSAIALAPTGEAYLAGRKGSQSLISKISADGKQILFSRQLGGTTPVYAAAPEEIEAITGIAVDPAGSLYVTGYTAYQDFPTTSGVISPVPVGAGFCGTSICRDAFVSKLSPDGKKLLYSTYLGSTGSDSGSAIAVDREGNAWVAGATTTYNFPYSVDPTGSPNGGIFLVKLDPQAAKVQYALSLGQHEANESANALALDWQGNVYITGTAGPHMAATSGAFEQPGSGVFVAKVAADVSFFVPIVISSSGMGQSFYTSELTLTNRSSHSVTLEYQYTAAIGTGTGTAKDQLEPKKQIIIPDAIAYLRQLKIPIPQDGNVGGTLRIKFVDIPDPDEAFVLVRTTTLSIQGRAGLAYGGVPIGYKDPIYLCGLRHNVQDRTNVALQNMGTSLEGMIRLRLTLYDGTPNSTIPPQETEVSLGPGEFKQLSGILQSGLYLLMNGYVKIERIEGQAPFYAYAVINDQGTSDGSFISPVLASQTPSLAGLTLPAVVEASKYTSEVVFTNWSATPRRLKISLRADNFHGKDSIAEYELTLGAGEQQIIPNFVNWFRHRWSPFIWPSEPSLAAPLRVIPSEGNLDGIFVGARTSAPASFPLYGYFGVFYPAVSFDQASNDPVWIYGLQQNGENRSNLAIVNTAQAENSDDEFMVELFDGTTGELATKLENIKVDYMKLNQIDAATMRNAAPGVQQSYARITRVKGINPFIVYAIINDGSTPGERTGDGSYVPSSISNGH